MVSQTMSNPKILLSYAVLTSVLKLLLVPLGDEVILRRQIPFFLNLTTQNPWFCRHRDEQTNQAR